MQCVECGSKMRKCSDPIKETFRGEEFTVRGIKHYVCDGCGEVVFDAEEGKKFDADILKQYAMRENLLSPQEIKEIRKKHGLSQRDFEKVLGVSSPSVSRWETGKVLQSKPVDLLMRAYSKETALLKGRMKQVEVRGNVRNIIDFPGNFSQKENPFVFQENDQVKEG